MDLVKVGGEMVLSLRLTENNGLDDINKSFQYINYEMKKEGEIVPYVVLNYFEWMKIAKSFQEYLKLWFWILWSSINYNYYPV